MTDGRGVHEGPDQESKLRELRDVPLPLLLVAVAPRPDMSSVSVGVDIVSSPPPPPPHRCRTHSTPDSPVRQHRVQWGPSRESPDDPTPTCRRTSLCRSSRADHLTAQEVGGGSGGEERKVFTLRSTTRPRSDYSPTPYSPWCVGDSGDV